jgi:hypothetical protein
VSATTIPYQLRTNKAIERQLFLELLSRLDRALHFQQKYEYIGLGGPFMEDFRILHDSFPGLPMISIERESEVLKRQQFNRPHSAITFKRIDVTAFVQTYRPERKLIAWLDYTAASELLDQTREFQDLLSKAPSVSVLKITVNANAASAPAAGEATLPIQRRRYQSLCERFGHLPLNWFNEGCVVARRYPDTILRIVELSVLEKLKDLPGFDFQPLCVFSYADGQRMLTITGLFGESEAIKQVIRSSRLAQWYFFNPTWSHYREIGVPELSSRERLFIRQLLPGMRSNRRQIRNKLRFDVGDTPEESDELLDQYLSFYRHLPYFERIVF